MKSELPTFQADSFNCPFCSAYSYMNWIGAGKERVNKGISAGNKEEPLIYLAKCHNCKESSVWLNTGGKFGESGLIAHPTGEMLYPYSMASLIDTPHIDMPSDVKSDYIEASKVFAHSRRSSTALLRLALQKLMIHLGEPGKNINSDIRSLAEKRRVPPDVIKVADTLRITGNNAVHPGEMNDDDFDEVAEKMFSLLNFIIDKAIKEGKDIESIYLRTPKNARDAAEASDLKNSIKS